MYWSDADRPSAGLDQACTELGLAGKLLQPEVREHAFRALAGQAGPVVVDLDPTSFCDLACPGCISSEVLATGRFSSQRLELLADELKAGGVRAVVLIGGGEPLMHRATPSLARRLSKAGVAVGLVTNGTLLGRALPELAGNLSWVRVSLDAGSAATYHRLRPGRGGACKFGVVVANIAAAIAQGGFKVGISYVVTGGEAGNIGEMMPAADLARRLGCSYIEFKAELAADHSIRAVPSADRDQIALQLDAARSVLGGTTTRMLVSSSLTALLNNQVAQPKSYHWCPVARLRTTITPGGVYVCAYHRGQERFKVADVQERSFAEVWDVSGAAAVDPASDCRFHCARHAINHAVLDGIPADQVVSDGQPTDWFI